MARPNSGHVHAQCFHHCTKAMSGVLVLYYSIEPGILDVKMVRSLASLSILVTLGSFVPRDLLAWIRKDDHIEGKRERHEARHPGRRD